MKSLPTSASRPFFGRRVVWAAFVMAVFGWGIGVYGPPVFLHAVLERTDWPLERVSFAVTLHFLVGAVVVANLPRIHARFGIAASTTGGAVVAALGVLGWSLAQSPWQLFAAALASGAGWVLLGGAVINAVIAPWYVRRRPMALANAYNGASVGGLIFSPLWVALIAGFGFAQAALLVGVTMIAVVGGLAYAVFAKTPQSLGLLPDGDDFSTSLRANADPATAAPRPALPPTQVWRDRRLVTLALGMSTGLFAQVGLLAYLYSLLVPAMGAQAAGVLMGAATAAAVVGRTAVARLMPAGADRRLIAAAAYAVQWAGTLVLWAADPTQVGAMVLGVLLFGTGVGNAISLPPLVAQAEFAPADVQRVVSLIVATSQAVYAFAPVLLGSVLVLTGGADAMRLGAGTSAFFIVVGAIQVVAIFSFWVGRRC